MIKFFPGKHTVNAGLLILIVCFVCKAGAQDIKKTMPPFTIQLTNKTTFSAKEMKKNVPAMLVYFSPTCEHCQDFTKHLLEKSDAIKKMQVVMVTYFPVADIKKFETDFHLEKYPNIKTGTEGNTFLVPKFYDIRTFPFIALFNKKGLLQATYRTPPAIDVLLKDMQKL